MSENFYREHFDGNNKFISITRAIYRRQEKTEQPSLYLHQNGHGHISGKNLHDWKKIFIGKGFIIEEVDRESIFFGGTCYNKYRFLFLLLLILDIIFDFLPFMKEFSEAFTFKLRKSSGL